MKFRMLIAMMAISSSAAITYSTPQQNAGNSRKPEIVLQAGISSPQSQIVFSPDGRLLASMGYTGNVVKLWEVSSGRLLRQFESTIPSTAVMSATRPLRFSPDGQTLTMLSGSRITRWQVETGREIGTALLSGGKDVTSAVLSDDARVIVAFTLNSDIKIWDATTGRELRTIMMADKENSVAQEAFAVSPNGRLVALLTETTNVSRKGIDKKSQVAVWEIGSGRRVQSLNVQLTPLPLTVAKVAGLTFSNDSSWIGLRDEAMTKIWDVNNGREIKTFASPRANTADPSLSTFAAKFIFSPDRLKLSFVAEGNKVNIVDSSSAAIVQTVAHRAPVVNLTFSLDSKILASSGMDNEIKLWDVTNGQEVRTLSGSAITVSDLSFSEDGKFLTVAGDQATAVWELNTSGVRPTVVPPDEFAQMRRDSMFEHPSTLSATGKFVAAANDNAPTLKLWEAATGRPLPDVAVTQGKQAGTATFSSDGRLLAFIERDRQADRSLAAQNSAAATANPLQAGGAAMPDFSKIMEQMQKDPKKMQEQMKKMEEAMKQGDLTAGLSMMQQFGLMGPANNPGKPPNTVRIMDVSTGRQLQTIPFPAGPMTNASTNTALSFSPDGTVLASSIGFGVPISLRSVSTGQEIRSLKASLSIGVNTLAWSPDGKRLASAHWGYKRNIADPTAADVSVEDMNFAISIWDVQTGAELARLPGHSSFGTALSFSRDGRMLASGSFDSSIKLWDVATGRELHMLTGHDGLVSTLEFSADGKFLVSGSEDGSVRVWNAGTGALLATMVSLNKGNDWVVVTPDGLFDGSPSGWNQILWRFSDRLADVSPVEIFFNEYFYPGLLADILAGKDVKAASGDIGQKDRRQPQLTLNADPAGIPREMVVKINVTDAPAGAQDVRLFRNGSLVKVWPGDVLKGGTATLETRVRIVAGANQFTAYAFNKDNVKSADATLSVTGPDSLKRSATLYLMVVGLNEYENAGYNLKYAVADAQAFAQTIAEQQRQLGSFGRLEVQSLTNGDATKARLLSALKKISVDAEPEDAVIIYYAGHGTAQGQHFYLIPHDIGYKGSRTELDQAGLTTILSHSISDVEIEQALQGLDAAHMLMVIDACNSGQALEAEEKRRGPMNSKGLAQLAYEKGMYILTAAQSYQAALEAEQLGHGYLTFALVEEGLKTPAADIQPKDGAVVVREWFDYATDRVPKMQEAKMKDTRNLKVAFVEGDEKIENPEQRAIQKPRVFYRRERDVQPMVVAKP
jgi:WD40 repeat protein